MPRRKKTIKSFSDEFEDFDDFNVQTQPQRNAANARERARMRVLSKAFCRLKTTLPWVPADTKLSKLDTLRLATSYIAHLRTILVNSSSNCDDGVKDEPAAVVHPKNLVSIFQQNYSKSEFFKTYFLKYSTWMMSVTSQFVSIFLKKSQKVIIIVFRK